ncbi:MAG: hypothetical protein M1469_05450 [Bacteroidetes bacterium]|nr:hypothetical protein [Bacteroidota bacterium]
MLKGIATVHLLLVSCVFAQGINFLKEDIAFHLTGRYFIVDGYYWFCNSSSRNQGMLIFYPIDASAGGVDSVNLSTVVVGAPVEIRDRTDGGFSFMLHLSADDTAVYRIVYRQRITADSAIYILRSTQAWNKPLESAEYKLILEEPITITQFSYKPDKVYTVGGKRIYFWKRLNFMPDKDMVIHFKSR